MFRKTALAVASLLLVVGVLVSCATPTPQIIEREVTKEVIKEVTQVVTQIVKETIKETVIVEGTPVVQEKEVTKVVEVEKVVTPTPTPPIAARVDELRVGFRGRWVPGFNTFSGAIWNAQGDIEPYFYMSLGIVNDQTEIIPWLAEGWEIADDCKSMTIHLHNQATWSDGKPLTTEDVKFFLELASHPEIKKRNWGLKGEMAYRDGDADGIEGIEILDDHNFILRWDEGLAKCFVDATQMHNMLITPKHIFEDIPIENLLSGDYDEALNPTVFSGPFHLGEYEQNVYFEAVAAENWWGESIFGPPKVGKIVAITGGDFLPMLIAGEIDVVRNIPVTEIDTTKAYPHLQVITTESLGMMRMQFNMRPERKLPDKIRWAIDYATDREAISQVYARRLR
jgi:ABC-type transport system substrate-binding protein